MRPLTGPATFIYSARRFGAWRIALGVYLAYYYARLLPFAAEIYSDAGPFPPSQARLLILPQFLFRFDTPFVATALVSVAVLASILFTLGRWRRTMSLLLWAIGTWLVSRNRLTLSPEVGLVNLCLFLSTFIPRPETEPRKEWQMPRYLYWSAWVAVLVGYLISGASKLQSPDPAWRSGTAVELILAGSNVGRTWYGDFFQHTPAPVSWCLALGTWATIVFELGAPVLALIPATRLSWWIGVTALQLGILAFVGVEQISIGMVLVHFFIWDERWNSNPWVARLLELVRPKGDGRRKRRFA